MQKVKTVTGMAQQTKGRICSLVIDNTRVSNRRIAAKIVNTGTNYATVYDMRNRKQSKMQYTSIASIGCGELVYHR